MPGHSNRCTARHGGARHAVRPGIAANYQRPDRYPAGEAFPRLGYNDSTVRPTRSKKGERIIRTTNWLRVLDDGFVAQPGGLNTLTQALGPDYPEHHFEGRVIVQAGPHAACRDEAGGQGVEPVMGLLELPVHQPDARNERGNMGAGGLDRPGGDLNGRRAQYVEHMGGIEEAADGHDDWHGAGYHDDRRRRRHRRYGHHGGGDDDDHADDVGGAVLVAPFAGKGKILTHAYMKYGKVINP
ncbi:type VI immunity family protein [Chelativorans alearense]|uniref:type VI immunity family protein n=1 Tax=Chelativorans alearense TaxID=2681495 RepID=UPI003CCDBE42